MHWKYYFGNFCVSERSPDSQQKPIVRLDNVQVKDMKTSAYNGQNVTAMKQ